jgi:hypothetical protein
MLLATAVLQVDHKDCRPGRFQARSCSSPRQEAMASATPEPVRGSSPVSYRASGKAVGQHIGVGGHDRVADLDRPAFCVTGGADQVKHRDAGGQAQGGGAAGRSTTPTRPASQRCRADEDIPARGEPAPRFESASSALKGLR